MDAEDLKEAMAAAINTNRTGPGMTKRLFLLVEDMRGRDQNLNRQQGLVVQMHQRGCENKR